MSRSRFIFYTAVGLHMMLPVIFLLSFIAGFVVMWLATIDSTDTVVFIEDEAEFHQECFDGMRRGIK